MVPEARSSSLALALALLLVGMAPLAGARSSLAPGDPHFLSYRDGWPQELAGTYVFVGGDLGVGSGDLEGGKGDRFCWRAGGDGRVGASEECWRHREGSGEAVGPPLWIVGEIILGAVVMGRPYCVLMIDDSGAHYPCCAFWEPSASWDPRSLPCAPPGPALLA